MEFARRVGIRTNTIYNYFKGSHRPEAPTLRRMCEVLGIPLEEGLRYCTPAPQRVRSGEDGTRARPKPTGAGPQGLFATKLRELMKQHDPPLNMRNLTVQSGLLCYEHARQLVHGVSAPSESLAEKLALFFGTDVDDLLEPLWGDRLKRIRR